MKIVPGGKRKRDVSQAVLSLDTISQKNKSYSPQSAIMEIDIGYSRDYVFSVRSYM